MVPSHRACGFAAGAALFPVYGWAGGVFDPPYEREPGWFPLIGGRFARACSLSGVRMGFDLEESLPATLRSG
jgi:hypothetical protein